MRNHLYLRLMFGGGFSSLLNIYNDHVAGTVIRTVHVLAHIIFTKLIQSIILMPISLMKKLR